MNARRLLVVDDEPINLEIISEFLDGNGYVLDRFERADQAWQRLTGEGPAYDLAILDRMMPGMNGLELLQRMKADARFEAIPVIMQTAATSPEQVREGIEAGAYYYLAKPYAPETLIGIVRAALTDIDERDTARRHSLAHVQAMELLDHAEFHFSRLNEVGPLIEVLASMCPEPSRVAGGLTELLVNAVEHGSLGITYAEKKRLRLDNTWDEEVARRLASADFCGRKVRVRIQRKPGCIEFTINDEGQGFDWERFLDFDPERAGDPNGRGIALARLTSFNTLDYLGCGNTVVATITTASIAPPV